jgi:Secretion system C-terminal sorting domain
MNRKFKEILHTAKYALPFAATAFFMQNIKGQDILYPTGVINPFISPDNTAAAQTYNALNSGTKEQRDNLVDAIIKASRVHTIPAPGDISIWNCQHWTMLELVNSYDWGKDIYNGGYEGAKLLYNNYDQFVLSEIYANGGTFADEGKNGIPLYQISFTLETGEQHSQVSLLTGNNALIGTDWNDIEERDGNTQILPGDGRGNITYNATEFAIVYLYIYKNSVHEKNLGGMRVLEFDIDNGKKNLTYNINDDPNFNQRMRLITQRESDPPTINIKQGTDPDSLIATVRDANLKSVWYTIDGGAKIPLMTEIVAPVTEKKIAIKMNLPNGTHQIKIGADDYFRLLTEKTEQRNIATTVNNPPIITITTPTEGQVFTKDAQLIYNITDNDFATAWYSLDNGTTKTTINQNGTITLALSDGLYNLLMSATDKKPQTTTKNVNFKINRPPKITITSPTEDEIYDKNTSLIYMITDTDFATAWYSLDNGTTKITIAQDGTIPLNLADGKYKILIGATDRLPQTTRDSVNFEMKKATGIEPTPITEGIKIYPNPVSDYLNIEYKFDTEQKIHRELYSLKGKLLYNDKTEIVGEQTDKIDMTKYKQGLYILHQTIGTETKENKIIKK